MRILITGASGYVAKFVAKDLEPDHELVLFSRRHPSEAPHGLRAAAPFVRGDLAVLDDCRRAVAGVVLGSGRARLAHREAVRPGQARRQLLGLRRYARRSPGVSSRAPRR